MKERLVCGNSNMHNLTREQYDSGISHICTEENPCDHCLKKYGWVKLIELIKEISQTN